MTIEDLEVALATSFPPTTIDRALIDEPSALWDVYDEYRDLTAFEGMPWSELPTELLVRHPSLLNQSHPKFDRRIAPFTPAQRASVRDVLALLATVSPMQEPMASALTTWNRLTGSKS